MINLNPLPGAAMNVTAGQVHLAFQASMQYAFLLQGRGA